MYAVLQIYPICTGVNSSFYRYLYKYRCYIMIMVHAESVITEEKTMIKLNPSTIDKLCTVTRKVFRENAENDVITITDVLVKRVFATLEDLGGVTVNVPEDEQLEVFYTMFDRYKKLRELYNELKYHHFLYKQGTTSLTAFSRVCWSLYFEG